MGHIGGFSLKPDVLWIEKLLESLELFQTGQKTEGSTTMKTSTPASWVSSMLSTLISRWFYKPWFHLGLET